MSPARPVSVQVSGLQALRFEYAVAVFRPSCIYSVVTEQHGIGEDGSAVVVQTTSFFKVIRKMTSKSRPHLVPTVEDQDDVKLTSPVS
eukprot:9493378-Pyramimonas_sp.AAC.1